MKPTDLFLARGKVWSCNGQNHVLHSLHADSDGDTLVCELQFVPLFGNQPADYTFEHWRYRRTVHIDGYAWEVTHWSRSLDHLGGHWTFRVARQADHDLPLPIDADLIAAARLLGVGIALTALPALAQYLQLPGVVKGFLSLPAAGAALLCASAALGRISRARRTAGGTR